MDLCIIPSFSGVCANICPSVTLSPTLTEILTSHRRSVSRLSQDTPLSKNAPDFSLSAFSGRSIPSNIFDIMPGPSRAQSGPPLPVTGSPIERPDVSSYTCIVVCCCDSMITSPIRRRFPTYTISSIAKLFEFLTVTTGPFIL